MRQNVSLTSAKPHQDRGVRWLALAGIIGPIQYVVVFTLAGLLRPGYSPLRQAVSALGVGANAWLLNTSALVLGVLMLAFAVGFYLSMRHILRPGWLVVSLILLILGAVGVINTAIFTAAPATRILHWTIGFLLGTVSLVIAYAVIGGHWLRVQAWRSYGGYSLLTAVVTLLLIALSFALLSPAASASAPQIGGLIERILVVVLFAWYVVIGVRLFVFAEPQPQPDVP